MSISFVGMFSQSVRRDSTNLTSVVGNTQILPIVNVTGQFPSVGNLCYSSVDNKLHFGNGSVWRLIQ